MKNHSRSDGILNVVSLDECHATYFALHLRRKKKQNFLFWNFRFLCASLQRKRTTTRPCTVYIVWECEHTELFFGFLGTVVRCVFFLRWMCASSVAIRTSISSSRVQICTQNMVPHSFWTSYPLPYFSTCKYQHVRHFGHCKCELEWEDAELSSWHKYNGIGGKRNDGAGPQSLLCPDILHSAGVTFRFDLSAAVWCLIPI